MGKYTAAHVNPQGAGDDRPTALQIIGDEGLEGKLEGKSIVITGATSGIGIETARALAATGATLFLTIRDRGKAEAVLQDILQSGRVFLVDMDNASFSSVKAAAAVILQESNNKINILVGNAGVMGITELTLTEDGHEVTFATNYLSNFLLFQLFKPALLSAANPSFHSRVVIVASSSHRVVDRLDSSNYDLQKGGYSYEAAYANSKLAAVYLANSIDRHYCHLGLHATSIHPGGINTDISRHIGQDFVDAIMNDERLVKILKSPEQGAATTVMAAVGKEWANKGGRYLEDCEEAKRGGDDKDLFGVGYVRQTYNPTDEERLWADSFKLVGLSDSE